MFMFAFFPCSLRCFNNIYCRLFSVLFYCCCFVISVCFDPEIQINAIDVHRENFNCWTKFEIEMSVIFYFIKFIARRLKSNFFSLCLWFFYFVCSYFDSNKQGERWNLAWSEWNSRKNVIGKGSTLFRSFAVLCMCYAFKCKSVLYSVLVLIASLIVHSLHRPSCKIPPVILIIHRHERRKDSNTDTKNTN